MPLSLAQLRPRKHQEASLPSLPPAEDRSNSYFVVAVVKRNSSYAFSLNELRGKRSCHSALGSPAGWDIPVGALVQRGFIQPKDCDVLTGATLHGNTDTLNPLWGWLGLRTLSQQDPTEGSPGEIFLATLVTGVSGGSVEGVRVPPPTY